MEKILLTTGGTGGHIFPALAVADELRMTRPDIQLLFVGSHYGPEKRMAGQSGIPFEGLSVRGLLGRGLRCFAAGGLMTYALFSSLSIVRRFRPRAAIGFGGYAAFAPMLAAFLLGVPTVLHEQNAVAGTGNRFLARFVRRVCLSWPDTQGFPQRKCVLTGNPVRSAVSRAGLLQRAWTTRRLLVLGGSQGARALNTFLPAILPVLGAAEVEIRHQSGSRDEAVTRAAYAAAGYAPDCVTAFIDDMAEAYRWADVALCRAGAGTAAEISAVGLPAVFVPLPHAIHDHQTHNARILAKAGAAALVPEAELRAPYVGELLVGLFDNPEDRAKMSEAALRAARPDAAAQVAAVLEETVCGHA
ncbi:UDP-N-acetylglucosamine--N-acetylmuramyl-(pentapeptide) pyrophosphoryl-undecaprenol N-acetylglucosamine transferase [Deltaproteobacteria bacterium]|nr:UDP-N-acetylglucosamine--N-acetylmuramyl-(pentapeptide) pyrophosphoryl-undecaprenol N-acetylglucosamine transferase [Deltaproteobacteria bacterium]